MKLKEHHRGRVSAKLPKGGYRGWKFRDHRDFAIMGGEDRRSGFRNRAAGWASEMPRGERCSVDDPRANDFSLIA